MLSLSIELFNDLLRLVYWAKWMPTKTQIHRHAKIAETIFHLPSVENTSPRLQRQSIDAMRTVVGNPANYRRTVFENHSSGYR